MAKTQRLYQANKIFNTRFANKEVSAKTCQWYVVINFTVNGVTHKQVAHRFIWFYIYGELPNGIIDHIDGDPSNNRVENLRDENELKGDITGVFAVVAGHTPLPEPLKQYNFYCLDTGACYTSENGYFTILDTSTMSMI